MAKIIIQIGDSFRDEGGNPCLLISNKKYLVVTKNNRQEYETKKVSVTPTAVSICEEDVLPYEVKMIFMGARAILNQ